MEIMKRLLKLLGNECVTLIIFLVNCISMNTVSGQREECDTREWTEITPGSTHPIH